ncbi:MAG TPA: methyltransferase [Candidatus Paceibacterota bacterium]|nr:methyltransferase [Candidatus Paceibacterota bacterium]
MSRVLQKEIRWLVQEKYGGRRTPEAEKDIARLKKGEHVDYVIGWVDFLGCKIDLSQQPLIPRPETEYWVGEVVEELRRGIFRNRAPYSAPYGAEPRPNPTISQNPSPPLPTGATARILDIFAGSGCVGVAVLKHVPWARVDFAEKDKNLLKQIRINARLNGISSKRYRVLQSDVFSGVKGKYDYILANPPYVPESRKSRVQKSVLEQEPYHAVFGGKDGLQYIRKFLREAKKHVVPGGAVYLEFDSLQKAEVVKLAKAAGPDGTVGVEPCKDQYNKWRYARIVFTA